MRSDQSQEWHMYITANIEGKPLLELQVDIIHKDDNYVTPGTVFSLCLYLYGRELP